MRHVLSINEWYLHYWGAGGRPGGRGEKSVIDKYLDEVSKVSFKVVFVKLDFLKEMGERERKKKGEAEEEVVGERGREGKLSGLKGFIMEIPIPG